MDKVSVFVDGANLFYAQRDLGWMIDYKKLLARFTDGRELDQAYYYTGSFVPPEARSEGFLKTLRNFGFIIREKKIKEFNDPETGEKKRKANLDIEIVIDMFNTANNYDLAVLCSGDGDFERAIELLRTKGKKIYVVSGRRRLAQELKNAVGHNCFTLEDMKDEIFRSNFVKRMP